MTAEEATYTKKEKINNKLVDDERNRKYHKIKNALKACGVIAQREENARIKEVKDLTKANLPILPNLLIPIIDPKKRPTSR